MTYTPRSLFIENVICRLSPEIGLTEAEIASLPSMNQMRSAYICCACEVLATAQEQFHQLEFKPSTLVENAKAIAACADLLATAQALMTEGHELEETPEIYQEALTKLIKFRAGMAENTPVDPANPTGPVWSGIFKYLPVAQHKPLDCN